MTTEEYRKRQDDLMQWEHQAMMNHKRVLNSIEDEHRRRIREAHDIYTEAVRKENDDYHERQERTRRERRQLKAQWEDAQTASKD